MNIAHETAFLHKLAEPMRELQAAHAEKERLKQAALKSVERHHRAGRAVDIAPYRHLFNWREFGKLQNRNFNVALGPEKD
jgi:hypothetical protein